MREPIENADYFVHLIPFPQDCGGVNGMVMPNEDGTYSIYINALASREQQRRAWRHELRHIRNNDFYNGKGIREIEDIS